MQDNLKNSFVKDLSQTETQILELKIYQPYFISNSTILEYQNKNKNEAEKLSIMDILETHFLREQRACKLFFKVNLSEHLDNSPLIIQENNSKLHSKDFNQSLNKNPWIESMSKN